MKIITWLLMSVMLIPVCSGNVEFPNKNIGASIGLLKSMFFDVPVTDKSTEEDDEYIFWEDLIFHDEKLDTLPIRYEFWDKKLDYFTYSFLNPLINVVFQIKPLKVHSIERPWNMGVGRGVFLPQIKKSSETEIKILERCFHFRGSGVRSYMSVEKKILEKSSLIRIVLNPGQENEIIVSGKNFKPYVEKIMEEGLFYVDVESIKGKKYSIIEMQIENLKYSRYVFQIYILEENLPKQIIF